MKIGVDIGGTFTDFVLLDENTGAIEVWKSLSTTSDPSIGMMRGLREMMARYHVEGRSIAQVVHGSTVAANTVIERKGAKTGLVVTKGFRDILEMARQLRYDTYNLMIDKPVPLLPRRLVTGVSERMNFEGEVLVPLDEQDVKEGLSKLRSLGVETLAISLLHSYANPKHEERIAEIIGEAAPDLPVSLSCHLAPRRREYERTSTTVLNAYVMPKVRNYLAHLESELREIDYDGRLYIMQSNGGLATSEVMSQFPVRMIESGPAAGALAAAFYGRHSGLSDLISFDMGGTTAKVCVIQGGKPEMTDSFEVDKIKMLPDSGLPILQPAINLIEIGAGGGSIASPYMGTIAVGPESAGADPGPISYGFGGDQPTVTDADLVLGYLNAKYFLGGKFDLDASVARRGIEEKIGDPLKLGALDAAWGIHEVVNASMAEAARAISVKRGHDPRFFSFIAFGGAGPVHACRIAKDLGMRKVVLPACAGVASALGLLAAEIKFDLARTYRVTLVGEIADRVNNLYAEMESAAITMLRECGGRNFTFKRAAEMRYLGQGYEVRVDIPNELLSSDAASALATRFNDTYRQIYGYSDPDKPIEVVDWKMTATCPAPNVVLKKYVNGTRDLAAALKNTRKVYFPEYGDYVDCPVYDWYRLFAGAEVMGPAIVEAVESTAVILPEDSFVVDDYGSLVVELR